MNNRLRWIRWGILGAVLVAAILLILMLWVGRPARLPSDAIVVPRDVESLAEALANASPGDTIVIQAGAGSIHGPITLEIPDLTLMSSGGRTLVNGTGGSPAISILADGVIVQGFDITSESIGILVDASDCTIEDIHIDLTPIAIQLNDASRCTIRSIEARGGQIGVDLSGSRSVVLENSILEGATEFGVRLQGSWRNLLRNLKLSGNAVGISIEQASGDNGVDACQIDRCSIAGIEIRASNDNEIVDSTITSVRIGIVLEGVTGTEIRSCDLDHPTVAGIHLQQSIQNRVLETHIRGSQGTGIQLTQSMENALLYNDVSACRDAGISLISSDRNLISGNEMSDCLMGIAVSRSNDTRILRNHATNSVVSGFLVSQGKANRLLDNGATNGSFGLVVVESTGNTILRNRLSGADGAGMFLVQTSGQNYVAENDMHDNVHGLVLAAVTWDQFAQNRILSNEIGILLAQLGSGVRIEGNAIADNQTGLKQASDLAGLQAQLGAFGIAALKPGETNAPVLANNVFAGNEQFDIQNVTTVSLPAAGNWWGTQRSRDSAEAVVSDGVLLEQSAWRGTLAVGTGSDVVRVLLGRILELTLSEAGFRVIDLVGMGPSQRVQQALIESDVDLIWWSGAAFESQSPMAASSPITVASFAAEGWRVIVSSQLASRLSASTVSDLSSWAATTGERLRYAAVASFSEDMSDAFIAAYGLGDSVRSFTRAEALQEVEALLKFGAVDVAIVGNLEETLTTAGFMEITDDLQVLDQQPLSMVIQQAISTDHEEIQGILKALGERLTSDVLHDLVSRIRLLHQEPDDVARKFVQQ
ncbi:right-handed parallel beta-helix repeat-containing protein [Candidatus Bipolaricaulota bacterium]|nr:right-handed parallel beta-helix repeat-containing protein [Candidatus Bipolaricaulota bacterium]